MRVESANHHVVLAVPPGVPLFELGVATEVFGVDRSDLTPRWYRFSVVGVGEGPVAVGHGLTVPAGAGVAAIADADTVVVPACADVHASSPRELIDALRAAHARDARIVSLCSGAFVLAQAGLLDGRRAVTHWMHAAELARRHPAVDVDAGALYVRDGSVWTSAGNAAAIDLCLEIVRVDHGRAVGNEVARRMVTPPFRGGGQAQYLRYDRAGEAVGTVDIAEWVERHLADATVASMARRVGVSGRTLTRRFRETTGSSPQAWLLRQRLAAAQELLETTTLTTEVIARRVGLGTAGNLRTRFRAAFGTGPADYRQIFGTAPR